MASPKDPPLVTVSEISRDKTQKDKLSRDRQFVSRSFQRNMFLNGFEERRDLEQYFWTPKTIEGIMNAIKFIFDPEDRCCLCTPSLAHTWYTEHEESVSLLDIDTRFKYLPKYHYFDLRKPTESKLPTDESKYWKILIFDPPFFYIPMEVLLEAVVYICNGDIKNTKLLLGFLKREEKVLLEHFKDFNLKETNFPLEYAHVKPNKWANYALYSNIDLPGIKRHNTKK